MTVPEELSRTVRARAGGRCQYCRMHESLQGATFHIEHIIPQGRAGSLAWKTLHSHAQDAICIKPAGLRQLTRQPERTCDYSTRSGKFGRNTSGSMATKSKN